MTHSNSTQSSLGQVPQFWDETFGISMIIRLTQYFLNQLRLYMVGPRPVLCLSQYPHARIRFNMDTRSIREILKRDDIPPL